MRLPLDVIHVENRFNNMNQRKPSLMLVPVSTKGSESQWFMIART